MADASQFLDMLYKESAENRKLQSQAELAIGNLRDRKILMTQKLRAMRGEMERDRREQIAEFQQKRQEAQQKGQAEAQNAPELQAPQMQLIGEQSVAQNSMRSGNAVNEFMANGRGGPQTIQESNGGAPGAPPGFRLEQSTTTSPGGPVGGGSRLGVANQLIGRIAGKGGPMWMNPDRTTTSYSVVPDVQARNAEVESYARKSLMAQTGALPAGNTPRDIGRSKALAASEVLGKYGPKLGGEIIARGESVASAMMDERRVERGKYFVSYANSLKEEGASPKEIQTLTKAAVGAAYQGDEQGFLDAISKTRFKSNSQRAAELRLSAQRLAFEAESTRLQTNRMARQEAILSLQNRGYMGVAFTQLTPEMQGMKHSAAQSRFASIIKDGVDENEYGTFSMLQKVLAIHSNGDMPLAQDDGVLSWITKESATINIPQAVDDFRVLEGNFNADMPGHASLFSEDGSLNPQAASQAQAQARRRLSRYFKFDENGDPSAPEGVNQIGLQWVLQTAAHVMDLENATGRVFQNVTGPTNLELERLPASWPPETPSVNAQIPEVQTHPFDPMKIKVGERRLGLQTLPIYERMIGPEPPPRKPIGVAAAAQRKSTQGAQGRGPRGTNKMGNR